MNKKLVDFLESDQIILRQYKEEDLQQWYQWFNDKEVTEWMDQRRFPNTLKKQREYLKRVCNDSSNIQLAIILRKNKKLIGTIGLHQIDYISKNADVSLIIGEKLYWGKGLGKDAVRLMVEHAFLMLNLHKVTAGFIEGNKGSSVLFTSLGFKQEGLFRDQIFLNGRYRNVIRMGLLRANFEKLNKK